MNRFEYLMAALQAEYADTTVKWFNGPEHVYRHDNWNRIVAYPTASVIEIPDLAAQGALLAELNTALETNARDDILWVRRTTIEVGIWGSTYTLTEHRLHAMLAALAKVVGSSDLEIDSISERWVRSETQDIAGGGALVVLSFRTTFYVLASDIQVLETEIATGDPGDVGEGTDQVPIENADITVEYETP